jgi:hypothetical protein
VAEAQAAYQERVALANSARKTALANGTNPTDLVALTNTIRAQRRG